MMKNVQFLQIAVYFLMNILVLLPLSWATLPYPLDEQCFQEKSRLTLDQRPFHVVSPITCLFLAKQLHFNAEEFSAYNSKWLFVCVIGSFFLLLLPMSFRNFFWRKWHLIPFFLLSFCILTVSHFSHTPQILTSYVFASVTSSHFHGCSGTSCSAFVLLYIFYLLPVLYSCSYWNVFISCSDCSYCSELLSSIVCSIGTSMNKFLDFLFNWTIINSANVCPPWPASYSFLSPSCLYQCAFANVRQCPSSFPFFFFFLDHFLLKGSIRRTFSISGAPALSVLGSPWFFLRAL